MLRAAVFAASVCAVGLASAAPVPAPSEKEQIATLWGKTAGGGGFELKGKQLTLRADGDAANLRVTRTVRGDFTAEVVVVEAACPDATKGDSMNPQSQAGLSVTGGDYRLELHLLQMFNRGDDKLFQKEPQRCVWVDRWFPRGGSGAMLKDMGTHRSVRLRVSRAGEALTVAHSFDGKEWSDPVDVSEKLELPEEVTVAVYFSHTTHQALHATFDKLTVEKPKPKK